MRAQGDGPRSQFHSPGSQSLDWDTLGDLNSDCSGVAGRPAPSTFTPTPGRLQGLWPPSTHLGASAGTLP